MALPREPRQKMINMMYLVLTALLALNVSSEILNAFKTVNNSLEKTNEVVAASTNDIMNSLKEKMADPGTRERATFWYQNAQKVQGYAKGLYEYIDDLKKRIAGMAKYDAASGKDRGVDNLEATTYIMVEKAEGKTLKQKLEEFKKNVLAVDPEIAKVFATSLPINTDMPRTRTKSNRTWEQAYFHMVPTVAALTILSKFQNDVKTSENKVTNFCHEQVSKVIYRPDAFAAIAIANTTNALPGQEIEIIAGVGGFNSKVQPVITIGGQKVNLSEDGAAHYKFKAEGVGDKSIPVNIQYTDQDGKFITVPTKNIQYFVGQSNAAVQLDKMNVLFIGVDNPVTISGSGDVNRLKAGISGGGGTLTKNGSGYIARVTQETDNCVISVTTPDGKTTPVRFRVRSIPDPTPMIGQIESGDIQANYFKTQAGVRAYVKNFFYETQFNVTSFRITGDGNGFEEGIDEANNTGAVWNEAKRIRDKSRPGSYIYIDNIYAIGPDGRRRKLTPLIYNLK